MGALEAGLQELELELLSPRGFVDPKADEEGAPSPATDLLRELGNKKGICSRMLLVTVRAGRLLHHGISKTTLRVVVFHRRQSLPLILHLISHFTTSD